jgi:hypothetical protein
MKYIFVFLCLSCSLPYHLDIETAKKYPMPAYNIDINDFVFDDRCYAESSYDWCFNNITYKKDYNDEWQTPLETLNKRTGDCEDAVILAMYLYYLRTGDLQDVEMHIIKGDINLHAVVYDKINHKYIGLTLREPRKNGSYFLEERLSIATALKIAEYMR